MKLDTPSHVPNQMMTKFNDFLKSVIRLTFLGVDYTQQSNSTITDDTIDFCNIRCTSRFFIFFYKIEYLGQKRQKRKKKSLLCVMLLLSYVQAACTLRWRVGA